MSLYVKSPFKNSPALMVQGSMSYLFGTWSDKVGPTLGTVLSDSGNGATSTVKFLITSGNVPVVDSLVTIVGTANAAGAYNVTNASILSVTALTNPDAGVYSITFSGTGNSASATDSGQLIIPQPEIGDVLTVGIVAALPASSAPVVSPVAGPNSVGKSLSATVKFPANTVANPSTLSGVTVVIQGSNTDFDTDYNTIGTVTTTGAAGQTLSWQSGQSVGTVSPGTLAAGSVDLINFRFYRFQVTAATGAGPIIAKLMQ